MKPMRWAHATGRPTRGRSPSLGWTRRVGRLAAVGVVMSSVRIVGAWAVFTVVGSGLVGSGLVGCGPAPQPHALVFPDKPRAEALTPMFQRGMNLGNGFEAPSTGEWGVEPSESHFRYFREAGFDHVRLPVRFSSRAEAFPPYTLDPEFLAKIDWAVDQAHRFGLGLILDMHHYEEMMEDPKAHGDRFVALWEQLAEHYAEQPPSIAFELLNEPTKNLEPELLNQLTIRAIAAIRKTNPTRTIIADSYFWSAAKYLDALELPDDPNVVASFHMYQPMFFTHQGAPWMEPWYQTRGVVFPGPPPEPIRPARGVVEQAWAAQWFEDYNTKPVDQNPSGMTTIDQEFAMVDAYMAKTGHPAYLGEFAVIANADDKSRANWLRVVRIEAEARGIGWAYWDDGGNMMALDVRNGDWIESIRKALVESPEQP